MCIIWACLKNRHGQYILLLHYNTRIRYNIMFIVLSAVRLLGTRAIRLSRRSSDR